MQWHEIRAHYPQQWLLLEAVKAHSEGERGWGRLRRCRHTTALASGPIDKLSTARRHTGP
ncbi:hypothetical protein [uncultured Thiodictyon sp.]|jgi:hypothetical protein|uniref:hypothetical protein n=1 Tax=uncultured Thiodictyon sp. TaxID=1846217 RepID=UPI0025D986BE|nr:hypothetical protein [uncultured Thiodictyon sp.]